MTYRKICDILLERQKSLNLIVKGLIKLKIKDKINMDMEQLMENGPITIVAFGDSITHGAFGPGEIDYDAVYWNILKKKLNNVRNYVPINVINAGIGGTCAINSLDRLDRQVLAHNPDLVTVCFGLNDVNGSLADYTNSLKTIFEKCIEQGTDVIFMTPNMLNTYVAPDTYEQHREYAEKTAEMQNSGKMDLFMESAVRLSEEMGITVCDCYSIWKELSKTTDTTLLLENRVNHPTREMHKLFADELFKLLIEQDTAVNNDCDTMWK